MSSVTTIQNLENALLGEMQHVAFLHIAIIGLCVCMSLYECMCVCMFVCVYVTSVDHTKMVEINPQFFHHIVGHTKSIQRRIRQQVTS